MKTGDPKGFQSSNLCASARLNKGLPKGSPFVFLALRIQLEYPLRIFREKRLIFHDFPAKSGASSVGITFTFGVQPLLSFSKNTDRNLTRVQMPLQFRRNAQWEVERDITMTGKRTTLFLATVVIDDLPPRPFEIRMLRIMEDSTTDLLQNNTLWYG